MIRTHIIQLEICYHDRFLLNDTCKRASVAELSKETEALVEKLVRRYVFLIAAGLIAANTIGIIAYVNYVWSGVSTAARTKFDAEADASKIRNEMIVKQSIADAKKEYEARSRELENRFNFSFVEQTLTEIVRSVGNLETEVEFETESAKSSAKKATDSSKKALNDSLLAQEKAAEAVAAAKKAASETEATLKLLQEEDPKKIGASIAKMIELMKGDQETPLSILSRRIDEVDKMKPAIQQLIDNRPELAIRYYSAQEAGSRPSFPAGGVKIEPKELIIELTAKHHHAILCSHRVVRMERALDSQEDNCSSTDGMIHPSACIPTRQCGNESDHNRSIVALVQLRCHLW